MRKLAALVLAGVVVISGRFVFTEAYFTPFPYIDTAFTQDFTWEKYDEIEVGMTKSQVYERLASPFASNQDWRGGQYSLKAGMVDGVCETYSRDGKTQWWDFAAWIGVNVCYDDTGTVVAKNELVHRD